MDYLQLLPGLIDFLTAQPATFWGAALTTGGGALAIASLLQVIKKKLIEADFVLQFHFWPFKWTITVDCQQMVMLLLGSMSLLASAADYVVTNNPDPAGGQITSLFAYLVTGAVFLHRFTVSPGYEKTRQFLTDVKTERARRLSDGSVTTLDVPGLEK